VALQRRAALDGGTTEVTTTQPDPQLPVKFRYVDLLSSLKALIDRNAPI
jgi:hypothetical protein